jgi:Rrf2 family cysteine metabolism transcriptional repressor
MRISKKAEYACFAMLELAANYRDPRPVRVQAIATAHGIPQRFLVQILLQLKGTGLVASSRGAHGGYQLARAPDKISLAEVINAIDRAPEPRIARNRKEAAETAESPTVRILHGVWREIDALERRLLEALPLSELINRSPSTLLTVQAVWQEIEAESYQI